VAGVLIVAGKTRMAAAREAAALIVHALERGRLEASADRAAQTELRALRAEILPHFVYNALTVIPSLVRSDPDLARDLMLDFADYTRYSLARQGEYTMVSDEFHAIETYLALQRAVLGDRLQVQVRWRPKCSRSPCRTWSSNRWWRTQSATASSRAPAPAWCRSEARQKATNV
jgi:two-component system LytT family sensor kinase